MVFAFMTLGYHNSTIAQQTPPLTDSQRYQNGYNDGLKKAQHDSQVGICDASGSAGHSLPYQKGYSVGYSKGHCVATSISSSSIPGLIFPP